MDILIVEDEQDLSLTIATFLEGEGNQVTKAETFTIAETKLNDLVFDLVLLDVTLPDGNGLNLIETIKNHNPSAGIIVLSARDQIEQKVDGLEKGADDYMTKPFHISELNARIKSLMRRGLNPKANELIHNEIKLDLDSYQLFVHDTEIKLTKTEFELLNYFISNKNRVLTKLSISKHVSKAAAFEYNFSDDFIYTHVKNLRKKLIKANSQDYIKTVYGVGYKFL